MDGPVQPGTQHRQVPGPPPERGVAVDASQYAMGHGAHPDEMAKLAKFVGDVLFPES